jgi:valyl-tRNA synthetase
MADFPKHYDHKEAEAAIQKFWEEEKIYRFDPQDQEREIYSVDTPPPYVSADHLHVGHAMSYSQAEFIVRYQRMKGKNIYYPMGFDDNGLPTERFVEKKHKVNKGKINRKDFVALCLEETERGAQTYRHLWKTLGISVDWSLSYSTINPHCQKTAQKSFLDLFEKGFIERREEPIIWCLHCQTSIAQADVETQELASALHDIAFKTPNGQDLIISTTRPELIPACVALFVHPEDERYQNLIGKEAIVPLVENRVPIKTDESVDKEFGTGLMMVCTWGDMEDVRKWKDLDLDTRLIFNANGTLNEKTGPLAGLHFTKARKAVLELLKTKGSHKKSEPIKHNVGIHERCDTPIDFHLAPQWFIKTLQFKEDLLKRG